MTDIILFQAQLSKEKNPEGMQRLIFVPRVLKEMHIHKAGEDGQYLWFDFIFDDGTNEQTGYYKET